MEENHFNNLFGKGNVEYVNSAKGFDEMYGFAINKTTRRGWTRKNLSSNHDIVANELKRIGTICSATAARCAEGCQIAKLALCG